MASSTNTLSNDRYERARELFLLHGGVLRTGKALELGVHPDTLYTMYDEGTVEKLSRGLFRLADLPPLGNPDLVAIAHKVPRGVVCLVSALAFHEMTTQIPHEIEVAIPRGAEPPRLDHPPVRSFWFSGRAFSEGIEQHKLEAATVRIYSPEKTIADCFKYRNKIGPDIAVEALKFYRESKSIRVGELIKFAKICRVEKVMWPYLEALI